MKKKSLIPLILFFSSFFFVTFFALANIDSIHDGILLKPAVDVLSGKILFRDTFTQYGALTTFIQTFAMKLFGPYLLAIRLITVLFYCLIVILLWSIWKQFLSSKLTIISIIFWLALAPFYSGPFHSWSSVYSLFFQCVALLLLLRYLNKNNNFNNLIIFFIGASSSLAFWCRQPVGIFLFLSVFGFFIFNWLFKLRRFKQIIGPIFYVFLGVIVSSIPFVFYLFRKNTVNDWWLQSFILADQWTQTVRGVSVMQVLKSLFITRYWRLIYFYFIWLLIPLGSMFVFYQACLNLLFKKKKSNLNIKLLACGFVCFASWLQYYPTVDLAHFFWAVGPMVGFLIYSLKRFNTNLITIIVLAVFVFRVIPGIQRVREANTSTNSLSFLKNIRLTQNEKMIVESWSSELSKHLGKNQTYVNTSGDPLISLLNPQFHSIGPMYATWEFVNIYKNYISDVEKYVAANHPIIATRYGPFFKDYCPINITPYFDPKILLYEYCGTKDVF